MLGRRIGERGGDAEKKLGLRNLRVTPTIKKNRGCTTGYYQLPVKKHNGEGAGLMCRGDKQRTIHEVY